MAANLTDAQTLQREVRALSEAAQEFRQARRLLLCETPPPTGLPIPDNVEVRPVWQWLLDG